MSGERSVPVRGLDWMERRMRIAKSTRPLPSAAQVIGFLAFIITVVVMGLEVPDSWALGVLAGMPFGLLVVGKAYIGASRERKRSRFDDGPSASTPEINELAKDANDVAVPAHAQRDLLVSSWFLTLAIVAFGALLVIPAIFDGDVPGNEVTMRSVAAGGLMTIAAFLYPDPPGQENSDPGSRLAGLAITALALAIFGWWKAAH
jgi:hypothetical protein